MINKAIIALGSNIDPKKNVSKARGLLSQKFQIIKESRFIRTKPIGISKQPDFINGVVYIQTENELKQLKRNLKTIETLLGRKKGKEKFGPRTIDLDIVVWNNSIIDTDFYKRPYLKKSVLEILPNLKEKSCMKSVL